MSATQQTSQQGLHAPVVSSADTTEERPLYLAIAGAPVSIVGLDDSLRGRLCDLLSPFVAPHLPDSAGVQVRVLPQPDTSSWNVTCDGHLVMTTTDPERLLTYLDWLTVAQALEATADVAIFHAAALVRDGVVVLLLAKSGAGKTTLTLGLMQRGWEPLTDDIAIVDRQTLGIAPFPRCFHLDGATEALTNAHAQLERAGRVSGYARPVRWAAGGLRPNLIVVVKRCETCPSSRAAILQAEAAGALVSAAIRNRLPKNEAVGVAARLVAGARAYRLRNGHLDGALNLIERAPLL
jgi:hypothetical protein